MNYITLCSIIGWRLSRILASSASDTSRTTPKNSCSFSSPTPTLQPYSPYLFVSSQAPPSFPSTLYHIYLLFSLSLQVQCSIYLLFDYCFEVVFLTNVTQSKLFLCEEVIFLRVCSKFTRLICIRMLFLAILGEFIICYCGMMGLSPAIALAISTRATVRAIRQSAISISISYKPCFQQT